MEVKIPTDLLLVDPKELTYKTSLWNLVLVVGCTVDRRVSI